MQLERVKAGFTAAWVTAAVVLGLLIRDLPWQVWVAFVAVTVLPPVALLFWWTDPAQTMSETINEARRKTWQP
jgi:membrane protein implicated in regulation of membrane protease activity